ncbi:MAG TPA: hypothetical protein VLA19_22145 [Herpetosiphonaceae bacterium]|nr:hypothetical protein [Herpetosiphonaceae bacterium]
MTAVTVLIGSPLEAEYAGMIRQVDPRVELLYRPDLLGRPRYHADHYALPDRSPEQEAEWRGLLARAEVMFDFDPTHMEDLLQLAPRLRWVQSTSSGMAGHCCSMVCMPVTCLSPTRQASTRYRCRSSA